MMGIVEKLRVRVGIPALVVTAGLTVSIGQGWFGAVTLARVSPPAPASVTATECEGDACSQVAVTFDESKQQYRAVNNSADRWARVTASNEAASAGACLAPGKDAYLPLKSIAGPYHAAYAEVRCGEAAVEDNLFAAGCSASLTLPQAIFLSRLLEGRGRNFPPRLVWELARVSESTFWRGVKSFDLAVSKAAGEHPELNEMEEHRRVAEILRRDLFPEFTRLWTGSLEVHTFQQAHATGDGHGIAARKKSIPTKAKRANGTRQAPAAPEPADGHLSRGFGEALRAK